MLTIRPEQLASLQRSTEAEYLRRVRTLLLFEDDELVAPHLSELDERIAAAFARARTLGLRQERSLTAFIRLRFAVGEGFDRHPLVARYFSRPGGTPDDRFDYLMRRIAPWEWEAVARELPGGR